MFIHLTYFTWAVHLLCIYFWCCKLFTWSFDFSTSQNINCFVAKINSSHWRKQQSCNTPWLWDERREALRGGSSVSTSLSDLTQSESPCSSVTEATGPAPRRVCSALNVQHTGERRGLLRAGIVKRYGDVQIRNRKRSAALSHMHACEHTQMHTRRPTLPSSRAVSWQRMHFVH